MAVKSVAGVVLASLLAGGAAGAGASPVGYPLMFDRVPTSFAVETFFRRVSRAPVVLCSEVLEDKRLVTMNLPASAVNGRAFFNFLKARGYAASTMEGVTYVCGSGPGVSGAGGFDGPGAVGGPVLRSDRGAGLVPGADAPQALAVAAGAVPPSKSSEPDQVGVYRAKFRDAGELADYAEHLFPDVRSVSLGGRSGSGQNERGGSLGVGVELAYAGPGDQVRRLLALLAELDRPGQVAEIEAVLLEVTRSTDQAWGLGVVASVLQQQLGVTIQTEPNVQQLRFSFSDFSGVLSALSGDGRVKVLSAPYVASRSGQRTALTVGDDTPVLGAVVQGEGGTVTQSVEYRSSGVILAVTPRVYEKSLEVDLEQEVSAFGRTATGVNASPTLTKRNIRTAMVVPEGQWVALGGLVSSRDDQVRDRLFPGGPTVGRRTSESRTELVLMLRVRRGGQA
jgi:hypothetical protein